MVKKSLSALALTLLLAGCNRIPPIDTTDAEARQASIESILAKVDPATANRLKAAVAKVDQGASIVGTDEKLSWERFDSPSLRDFLVVVESLTTERPEVEKQPDWPNAGNASRVLRTYQVELDILEKRRRESLESGQQLVDQFPLTDFRFIPPSRDGSISESSARFSFQVANKTRFDAYRPSVKVTIQVPGQDEPVFQREFSDENNEAPIDPGAFMNLDYECCGAISDPFYFDVLSTLPVGTKVTAELVNIEDHGRKPMINMQAYSITDENRRLFVKACIHHLEPKLATWTPPSDGHECMSRQEFEDYQELAVQASLRDQVADRVAGSPDSP